MEKVDIVICCVLIACVILTIILSIKTYRLGKKCNFDLLPGCLWNITIGVMAGTIVLAPIALTMELIKYHKIKKYIKESNPITTPEIVSPNQRNNIQSSNNNKDTDEEESLLIREQDLVTYFRTDGKTACNLDPKAKYRHKLGRKILVSGFDFVNQGDKLVHISYGKNGDGFDIKASEDGYFVDGATRFGYSSYTGDHLFTVYKSMDALQAELFPSVFETDKDDFTKEPFIKATKFGGDVDGFFLGKIYIRIEYSNGRHRLNVDYCTKDLQFTKKQSLHFLLDNGSVLSFRDFTRPIKYTIHKSKYEDINMTTSAVMTKQDIVSLAEHQLIKWQLINDEGSIIFEFGFPPKEYHQKIYRQTLQIFASKYLTIFDEINNTTEETLENEKDEGQQTTSSCYVYLMIDTTNNFHKIGISNNPKYREHTLQSDKPTIELICAREFPTRELAKDTESMLHKHYAEKRVRGEWFNLDDSDLVNIKKVLQ